MGFFLGFRGTTRGGAGEACLEVLIGAETGPRGLRGTDRPGEGRGDFRGDDVGVITRDCGRVSPRGDFGREVDLRGVGLIGEFALALEFALEFAFEFKDDDDDDATWVVDDVAAVVVGERA